MMILIGTLDLLCSDILWTPTPYSRRARCFDPETSWPLSSRPVSLQASSAVVLPSALYRHSFILLW